METQTRIGGKQIAIILLGLVAAGIHFSLLFPDPVFILSGLGYLGLLTAYFLPLPIARERRGLVRWAFMGYITFIFLAWVAIGDKSWPAGALGYFTKLVEVILLALLWTERQR